MALMARYPDKYFDLAIVDPPYGIDINSSGRLGHYGGKGKTWDTAIPTLDYFRELYRVSKNQIIWGGNYFPLPPSRCFLIWDKQQPDGVSFADAEFAWTSFDASAKTFRMRPQNADPERIHPTQKPVALYRWLLERYAKPGQTVLDTHLGSGSHAIAAHYAGVHLTACEIDADYFAAAQERIARETRQTTLF
jgi:site-specific DNA-methyltransferase (adenine-specific)